MNLFIMSLLISIICNIVSIGALLYINLSDRKKIKSNLDYICTISDYCKYLDLRMTIQDHNQLLSDLQKMIDEEDFESAEYLKNLIKCEERYIEELNQRLGGKIKIHKTRYYE